MPEITVYGFEALTKALAENNSQRKFVLFTGSKDKDGVSWCSDCNDAFPHIKKAFSNASDVILIVCEVGPRDEWKNPNNDFRKKLGVKCVPTLINWEKKEIKLEEEQCLDDELLDMMLED